MNTDQGEVYTTTTSASTFDLSNTNSTTSWIVVTSGSNGDFTIASDPLEAMRLQFDALSKKFFDKQADR